MMTVTAIASTEIVFYSFYFIYCKFNSDLICSLLFFSFLLRSLQVPIGTDPSTLLNKRTIDRLEEADRIIVCGQQLSHAVNFTVRDLVSNWSGDPSRICICLDGRVL